MSAKRKVLFAGWVGIVEGKPYFEKVSDNYSETGENVIRVEVFRSRMQAKKRFEKVALVSTYVRP